uniref:Ig-like domain-containing protein n=1 Tax=Sinocyclocheilus grahami TaxID=75366 RepID=A0A672K987_SINGR
MFVFTWIIIQLCIGTSFADTIQPLSSEKYVVEGKNVTLSCNYSTTGTVESLQWYRQYLGAKPEFLLQVNEYSSKSEPDLRLYSKATKEIKRVDLIIFSAAVSDSALYYCALRPTVTGNTRTLYKNLLHSIASVLHKCVS